MTRAQGLGKLCGRLKLEQRRCVQVPLLLELLIGGDALRVRGRASTPNEHMCMSLLMMSSLPPPPASQSSKVERAHHLY